MNKLLIVSAITLSSVMPSAFAAGNLTIPFAGPLLAGGGLTEFSGGFSAVTQIVFGLIPNASTLPGLAADGLPILQNLGAAGLNSLGALLSLGALSNIKGSGSELPTLAGLPVGSLGVTYLKSLPNFAPAVINTLKGEVNPGTLFNALPQFSAP
jgi:hypothetical protein